MRWQRRCAAALHRRHQRQLQGQANAAGKTIKGTATLRLIPLGSDPLAPGEGSGRQFEIIGQRIEAQ